MLSKLAQSLRAFATIAIGAIALIEPANAQSARMNAVGEMAISANGGLIAFTVNGAIANEFFLFDTDKRSAFLIETTGPYVGDFSWSPDGDELTFITADQHTFSGESRHVWRLRATKTGPEVELLALIPYVRSPVLSADGARMAAFEGVFASDGQTHSLEPAYAIFERTLADGQPTRRSEGHTLQGGELTYDRNDNLYILLNAPVFPHSGRFRRNIYYSWWSRDASGRWDYDWRRSIGDATYFRLSPGETLPAWPAPFALLGVPHGAGLVKPLDDGRFAFYASDTPTRTTDWYDERGLPRIPQRSGPLPYNYVAYAQDRPGEVLVRTLLPEGVWRTGGADLSSNGITLAQVVGISGDRDSNMLMVFERGALAYQMSVSELREQAQRLVVGPDETPLLPPVSEPHMLAVNPPP